MATDPRHLFLLAALWISACGALARTSTLDEPLPPAGQRTALGAWDLGDGNCIGSLQAAGPHYFWVADCSVKAGYGWCDYGLPLAARGPGQYANDKRAWSFTINDDGSLTESRKGKLVGRYAASSRGVCGVRGRRPPS